MESAEAETAELTRSDKPAEEAVLTTESAPGGADDADKGNEKVAEADVDEASSAPVPEAAQAMETEDNDKALSAPEVTPGSVLQSNDITLLLLLYTISRKTRNF